MINYNRACFLCSLVLAVGCDGDILPGGSVPVNAAGTVAQGGSDDNGGVVNSSGGLRRVGGTTTGSSSTGSVSSTGGVSGTGGTTTTGGTDTGGTMTGDSAGEGGVSTGGLLTGGSITGGTGTGGVSTGGVGLGGTGGIVGTYNCTASTDGTCGIRYAFQCASTPPGECTAAAAASVYCCTEPCAPASATQSGNCKEAGYQQPYMCYGNQVPSNCIASSIANIACCPGPSWSGSGGANNDGGAGGVALGTPDCTEATAIDLGAFDNTKTSIQTDGCAKVTNYPSWWGTTAVYLNADSSYTDPIPFVWENVCSGASGEGTITGPHTTVELGDVSDECSTVIGLNGPPNNTVEISWNNGITRDCLGGENLSGVCQAVKLASGDHLFDVAVDETHAYFVSYQENGYVARVPLIGGDVEILASEQNGPARITVNETHVFWSNYLGSTVNQMLKSGGPLTTIGPYTSPLGIEVDDTHVYWADNTNDGTLYRRPLSGGNVETLTNTATWAWGLSLDSDAIYYTAYGASAVYSLPLSGGNPVLIANTPDYPTALTISNNVLFWVSINEIQYVPAQGGTTVTLASDRKPYGIAVKGDNVYFTDENEKSVLSVPKSGGDSIPVATDLVKPRLMTADDVSILWADFNEDTTQGGIYRLAVDD